MPAKIDLLDYMTPDNAREFVRQLFACRTDDYRVAFRLPDGTVRVLDLNPEADAPVVAGAR